MIRTDPSKRLVVLLTIVTFRLVNINEAKFHCPFWMPHTCLTLATLHSVLGEAINRGVLLETHGYECHGWASVFA